MLFKIAFRHLSLAIENPSALSDLKPPLVMWLALSALLLEIGLKSTKNMEGPVPPSPGSDSPGTSSSSTSSIRLLLYGQAIQVLEKSVSCLESVNIQKLLNISRQSLCGKKEIFLIFHMGYKATKAHFWLKLQGKA